MSDREELVNEEVQNSTIAMDSWASLEHEIHYKYKKAVLQQWILEVKEAAFTAIALDRKMERFNKEITVFKQTIEKEKRKN